MVLHFQTNHISTVEKIEPTLWRVLARSDDNLFSAEASLEVRLPALDIRRARLSVSRDVLGVVPDLSSAEEKLIGVRVGPGMTKIVRGLVGGQKGSDRMAELVLEAMEMLVNALSLSELRKAMEKGGESVGEAVAKAEISLNDVLIGDKTVQLMAANPRLRDSCAAFLDV